MHPLREDDPATLGPFTLRGRLGAGGMGVVYLAELEDGTEVAVKTVPRGVGTDVRIRLQREADLLAKIDHPRIARFVDADADADEPWLAMRYVSGPSLSDADLPLPPQQLRQLADGLAESLAALHKLGVTHRDVKPGNVIMTSHGAVLVDLGIAVTADAASMTMAGTAVGSPAWMAPEQFAGDSAGPPADVWGWAAVLTYAATGREPFGAGTLTALAHRIMTQPPNLAGVPPWLVGPIQAAMTKQPERRPTALDLTRGGRARRGFVPPPMGAGPRPPTGPGQPPFAPRHSGPQNLGPGRPPQGQASGPRQNPPQQRPPQGPPQGARTATPPPRSGPPTRNAPPPRTPPPPGGPPPTGRPSSSGPPPSGPPPSGRPSSSGPPPSGPPPSGRPSSSGPPPSGPPRTGGRHSAPHQSGPQPIRAASTPNGPNAPSGPQRVAAHTTGPQRAGRRKRNSLGWLIGAAVVAAAIVVGIVVLVTSSGGGGSDAHGSGSATAPTSSASKPSPSSTGVTADDITTTLLKKDGLCVGGCSITGKVPFTHPKWGKVTLVTTQATADGSKNSYAQVSVIDATGASKWDYLVGPVLTFKPIAKPVDKLGHIFMTYNAGRYDGIVVVSSTTDSFGMTDYSSVPLGSDPSDWRFYDATTKDVGGQYQIVTEANSCDPDCADGKITHTYYAWNGLEYVKK